LTNILIFVPEGVKAGREFFLERIYGSKPMGSHSFDMMPLLDRERILNQGKTFYNPFILNCLHIQIPHILAGMGFVLSSCQDRAGMIGLENNAEI
jgi:hypothetical protein